MKYLFSDFLNNAQEYKESRRFWEDLCLQILLKHKQSDFWHQWFDIDVMKDSVNQNDGNPIYSLINRIQLKGVRIIQQNPKIYTKWEQAAWVDVVGSEYSEYINITELVFTCNLTLESAEIFKKLFEAWIQPEAETRAVEGLIKKLVFK
jgi:hypothetical protein